MSNQDSKDTHYHVSICAVEPSDVDDLVAIHTAAFESDQFSNLMLLNREECAHQNLMRKSVLYWLTNPSTTKLFKAVEGNGKLLGWSCWVKKELEQKKSDDSKSSEAPSDPNLSKEKARSGKDMPREPARVLGGIMHKDMTSWESRQLEGTKYMVLQALATHPEYQGRGIGTRLLQHGLEKIDSQSLACWIHASPSSYRLYEKAGFQEVGKSEYDLAEWAPVGTGGEVGWGTYTFRYMLRSAKS
ncbi:acyl-CoA N-acyltransferase [Colletotrichum acutatum]|uniref:Acyl-CoA N-acyltransferase n=1 Tax=Glomerella acutata TaxID=27357 RepID=A0AAD8XBC0_GLOAC|nr:acyl-CoA N-acyltransferase [Colletotrichum acutatum]KAK1705936.1 acyl-CoA N-acyltransferase [Colletotrichum acutatum]